MKRHPVGSADQDQGGGGVATQTRLERDPLDDSLRVRIRINGFRCANGHETSRTRGVWLIVDEEVISFSCPRCGSDYVVAPVRGVVDE